MDLQILENLGKLSWGTSSHAFDDIDIRLARPCLGVVAQLLLDDELYSLRKGCEDFLLMKTRDDAFHVTIFQVFITCRNDYCPSSLPDNLLESFYAFINNAIGEDVEKINKNIETLSVVTKDWIVLGRHYPSHLAVKVNCRQVSDVLQTFKEKLNNLGYKWMYYLSEELQNRGFHGQLIRGDIGHKLSSNGWDLTIGYTSNPDYQTHITMGLLPTNDQQLNEMILKVHDNVGRNIVPKFSSSKGRDDKTCLMKSFNDLQETYKIKELKALQESEIDEFPTLKSQVKNAKEGKAIQNSKNLVDEWGKFHIRRIYDKLEKRNVSINFSSIKSSILNVDMIQNFEPVYFGTNMEEQTVAGQSWVGNIKPAIS